jgi:quercetin dioxygenase-like cupin family protein
VIVSHVTDRQTELGPTDWFTGTVWLDEIAVAPRPSGLRVHRVTFQPGARTALHSHPLGQVLHGIAGFGLVGFENEPPQRLVPGSTIWIEPGKNHWHGAAPGHLFVHLAIQEADFSGNEAQWFEHVSEVDYLTAADRAFSGG